ncbi:MAG: hypothetical protein WC765_07145, partial [Phycisphaerae bacterium]
MLLLALTEASFAREAGRSGNIRSANLPILASCRDALSISAMTVWCWAARARLVIFFSTKKH